MEFCSTDSAIETYFDEHSRQLDDLRRKGLLCDVELCCEIKEDGLTFPIHRAVMAGCSPYFRALFTYTKSEEQKTVIKIPGISDRILKEIVEFAYTGKVQVDEKNVESLLSAADMLHVMGVLKACSEFLTENLTADNCIGIYKFATFYNSMKLSSTARNFILVNFVEISQSSTEFLYLHASELKELCCDDELNVRQEEDVANAVFRWIEYDAPIRNQYLAILLSCIRYGYVSMDYFLDRISNHHQIARREDCQPVLKSAWEIIQLIQNEGISFIDVGNPYVRPRVPNDILFVVGGWSSHGTTTSVETYDTRSDRWYRLRQDLPTPRAYHGVVTLNDKIYIIGGYDGIKYHNGMQYFDCVRETWCESAPMYIPRCYVTVSTMGGLIYACGGYDGRHRQNTAERYDPSANQWLMIAPMATKRSDASGCCLGGKLYVVGGFDGHSCLETAEMYNPGTDQWTTIEAMSKRRSGLGVLVYRGEMYAAGGYDGTDRLESVEKYSPGTDSWSVITDMSVGRSNFAFEVIDDMMFIIGGYDGNSITSLVECYDVKTQTWYDASSLNVSRSATRASIISNLPNKRNFTFYGHMENRLRRK